MNRFNRIPFVALLLFFSSIGTSQAGTLLGWGSNTHGQSDVPAGDDFVGVAGGSQFSLALKGDGSLVGWGSNDHGRTDVPSGVPAPWIGAGAAFACSRGFLDGDLSAHSMEQLRSLHGRRPWRSGGQLFHLLLLQFA